MDKISDFFSNFFSTIQTKWQGFTTIQKGGVAGGFVVFLGSLMTFFVYQNNTTSVYLFKNMSDEDTVAISSFLKKSDYKNYTIDDKGIKVDKNDVDRLRITLSQEGLPNRGVVGWESFDSENFARTEFEQQVQKIRAIQGELARTISSIDGVVNARIHIVTPKDSLFVRDKKESTASIYVQTKRGYELEKKQIKGIQHLVSNAVEGLKTDNISILDSNGKLLTEVESVGGDMQMSKQLLAYKTEVEKILEERIRGIVGKTVGSDRIDARVDAEVDFTKEVQLWICIFMGKCAFNIGELENWQILMYLLGAGNAGKSTILTKILQKWYDEDDIGIIPNNIEKQYGLKPHINKFMVLAPEMQGDCKLEQTDWQLMCEGGKNSFAEKYKNAESEYWRVPMAMAGNSLIKFQNMGGQVSRRTAVVNFSKQVVDVDQNLDKKLEKELPYIMKMCISGYLWAVNKYGDKGIWKILPHYFHENKNEMDQTTNILEHFLKSDKIIIDKDRYIPEKIFKQAFNEHCRENNLGKERWSFDFYSTTFSNNNIIIKKNTKRKYPAKIGDYISGTYFIGIDIRSLDTEDNDDPE